MSLLYSQILHSLSRCVYWPFVYTKEGLPLFLGAAGQYDSVRINFSDYKFEGNKLSFSQSSMTMYNHYVVHIKIIVFN